MKPKKNSLNKIRRVMMWVVMAGIILLWLLSLVGAFLGAEKARLFFNSFCSMVYWVVLLFLLTAGMFVFKRLLRKPALLLIHAGCILILFGAFWSSDIGHRLQYIFFGIEKVPRGYMLIQEGTEENRIVNERQEELSRLPFSLYLNDFSMDYYWGEGSLLIQAPDQQSWRIPDRVGHSLDLPGDLPRLKILRRFRNFRIDMSREPVITYDDPHSQLGYNPALEIELEDSQGNRQNGYVFTFQAGHTLPTEQFDATYEIPTHPKRDIRDYYSDLTAFDDEHIIDQKIIEVNKPLHVGGYHFYQSSYDDQQGQYTILSVVSDTGVNVVFTGFFILCLGIFGQLWVRSGVSFFQKQSSFMSGADKLNGNQPINRGKR